MTEFSSADPNAYVALAIQSAQGTPQATPAKWRFAKYSQGNSFAVTPAVVDLREGGDGLEIGVAYKSGIEVSGQIVCYPRPEFLGQALALIPGGATWLGASDPAVHRFHTNHASHPWSSMQVAHPGTDLVQLLSDVRFTGYTLLGRAGMPWQLTMPFRAITIGASSGIALVPSYTPQEEFFLYHGNPSYLIDGVADSTIESISIQLALGIEPLQAQSVYLDTIPVQNRKIDVQITRRYQDATLWKKIHLGGGVAATTSVATGALSVLNQFGAGASLKYFKTDLGLLSYRNNVLTELNPDGQTIKETVSAVALKTASAGLVHELRNAHASAYGA